MSTDMHAPTGPQRSPYLEGNFAPVHDELDAHALKVIGELPRELAGMFVRNGPNPQFAPKGRYHWFDGDGMLHAVSIREGRARYRNRWVKSAGFLREREVGHAIWTGLMEPPVMDPDEAPFKNTANTALAFHDGRMLALWEAGSPHHVRLPSLETVGEFTHGGRIHHAVTAHPKVDPVTGEMVLFGYGFAPPFVQYAVVTREGAVAHTAEIDLPVGVMMHDFAVTERFSLLMDLPLTFRFERIEQGKPPLAFERDLPSRFGLFPRHGSNADVRWFEGPSCYVFHTVNAYEDGSAVVLYAARKAQTNVLGMSEEREDTGSTTLHRWRFDLATGQLTEEQLDDQPTEFPRINERYLGRRHRYAYLARYEARSAANGAGRADALVKHDNVQARTEVHTFGAGRWGGEGVFVPREGAASEDDGWVMTYVFDERAGASELVVVDARHFTAEPVARVLLPARVPFGFHGAWVSDAQIASQR